MSGIIDFHSHILPGIDDGSSCLEESIAMLQRESQQGIRYVVATPHFYPQYDTPDRFLKRRADAESALRKELQGKSGLPTVFVGAEVFFFSGMSNSEVLSELTINQQKCILVEMPASPWTDYMYRELEDLYRKQGLFPVIAHVDRYIGRFRNHGILERLEKLPVLVQANAEFFLHKSTAAMALRMLKKNQIHLLGSDCHNLSNRSPCLGDAMDVIRRKLGESPIEVICDWQQHVLQNK